MQSVTIIHIEFCGIISHFTLSLVALSAILP